MTIIIKLSLLLFFISNKYIELVVKKLKNHLCFFNIYVCNVCTWISPGKTTYPNLQIPLGLNQITVEGSRGFRGKWKKRQNPNIRHQSKIHEKGDDHVCQLSSLMWRNFALLWIFPIHLHMQTCTATPYMQNKKYFMLKFISYWEYQRIFILIQSPAWSKFTSCFHLKCLYHFFFSFLFFSIFFQFQEVWSVLLYTYIG